MKTLILDIKKKMHTNEGERYLNFAEEIKNGEFISLVGHSGCGKSTLLRILAGLIKPDAGTVQYGEDIWFDYDSKKNIAPQKRNIAYMFQDFALFPNMNVEQNIEYAQKEKNKDSVNNLIQIFGLTNLRSEERRGGKECRLLFSVPLVAERSNKNT